MASIVTSLITHYRSNLISQQVNNLALALIAPLGTQDDNILTHVQPMPR
jgi:hypothetical protein